MDPDGALLDRHLYETLRSLAERALSRERPEHTLQPTALVHEAYLALAGKAVEWNGRQHFLAAAAVQMRRILVDHARAHRRDKRGGDRRRVTLSGIASEEREGAELEVDAADLDEALCALGESDPAQARIVELRYFGGLSYEEIAEVTGASRATVGRELRFARAWLKTRLAPS